LRSGFLAVVSQKQKGTGQPFFAGIEELVDQVLFDSDVASQHIRDENGSDSSCLHGARGSSHFLDIEYDGLCDCGSRGHAHPPAGQEPLAKKIARPQNGHDGFFASGGADRKFYGAFLNVHQHCSLAPLAVDRLGVSKRHNFSRYASGIEKRARIEGLFFLTRLCRLEIARTRDYLHDRTE